MKTFAITIFSLLIILSNNLTEGALIKVDVSQQPLSINADNVTTWRKNGTRIFSAAGNVKIEQGDVQVIADNVVAWFTETRISQHVEGNIEVYCEGNISLFQDEDIQNYKYMYLRFIANAGVVVNATKGQVNSFEEEQMSGIYIRGKAIQAEGKDEFASNEAPQILPQAPASSISAGGVPIDIFADDIDTWVEKDMRVVVATGNVRIKKNGETLEADNVILYFAQVPTEDGKSQTLVYKEVYAEGNATLRREKDIMIADKIFEVIEDNKGLYVNSIIRTQVPEFELPTYIVGEEIKHRGKGRYDTKNGHYTTCSFGHPHFRFKSSNIRLFKTDEQAIVSARKNVFYVGNLPLFYLPHLALDLTNKDPLLEEWETGSTSIYGQYIKTVWNVYNIAFGDKMRDWSDLKLRLDYLQLRGPAIGVDFDYAKNNYFGELQSYFIRDKENTGINHVPIDVNTRGHLLWRHRQLIGNDWRADAEISYVSDRNFFREYFPIEFKTDKGRETMLYLRKISDNRGTTLLVEKQLRSYDTLVDKGRLNRTSETLPELKYRKIGEPLWDGRLNLTSETELAYFDRIFDGISPKRAEVTYLGRGYSLTAERVFDRVPVRLEPEETFRFDTDHTLNAPFRFMGIRFNPFVGARFTGYSESVKVHPTTFENKGEGTPRGRITGAIGFNTSTTLSRTYSVYNKLLNINRLKHIMVPEISFNFIPIVTQSPEDLNQHDKIDTLDTFQSITLGIHNRFQTKRGVPGKEIPVDFVDFDLAFNFFPGNAGLNRKRDDYINLDLRIKLSDKITFLSERNEFNLGKGSVDIVNLGIRYNNLPKWNFFIGSRYIDDISSSIRIETVHYLNEKWHMRLSESYDFKSRQTDSSGLVERQESQNLNTTLVFTRFSHDWIANVTFVINEVRDDSLARIDIMPKGINKVFSSNQLFQ